MDDDEFDELLARGAERERQMQAGLDAAMSLGESALIAEVEQLDREGRDEIGIRMARVHVAQGVEPTLEALREAMDPDHWAMFLDAMHRRSEYGLSDPER